MAYVDVLVHEAVPTRTKQGEEYVEGRYEKKPGSAVPFDCCLFLPTGTETPAGRGRQVREPTLLVGPEDRAGVPVALKPEDELLVRAPELNVAEGLAADAQVRWTVASYAQPFGKPGLDVIGYQVTLRRVED